MTDTHPVSEESRERLLRAARNLFCQKGYVGTSIREIAREAEVNSALIKYYFGDKEGLFRHVFREVTAPLNAARRARFERLRLAGRFDVEDIVRAWVEPMFENVSYPTNSAVASLSLGLTAEYGKLSDQLISEVYDETNLEFLLLLERCLPNISRASVVWRLYFLVGAVLTATRPRTTSMLNLSGGDLDGKDYREMSEELIAFASAGFCAGAGSRS